MKYVFVTFIAFYLALAGPSPSYAASAPAWHLGSFSKSVSLKLCHSIAKTALDREHLKMLSEDDYTLVAGNRHVIAQVSCSPQADGTVWVVVTAYSDDSALAEAMRNRVRDSIVNGDENE